MGTLVGAQRCYSCSRKIGFNIKQTKKWFHLGWLLFPHEVVREGRAPLETDEKRWVRVLDEDNDRFLTYGRRDEEGNTEYIPVLLSTLPLTLIRTHPPLAILYVDRKV